MESTTDVPSRRNSPSCMPLRKRYGIIVNPTGDGCDEGTIGEHTGRTLPPGARAPQPVWFWVISRKEFPIQCVVQTPYAFSLRLIAHKQRQGVMQRDRG